MIIVRERTIVTDFRTILYKGPRVPLLVGMLYHVLDPREWASIKHIEEARLVELEVWLEPDRSCVDGKLGACPGPEGRKLIEGCWREISCGKVSYHLDW